jgi:hypothetical protein
MNSGCAAAWLQLGVFEVSQVKLVNRLFRAKKTTTSVPIAAKLYDGHTVRGSAERADRVALRAHRTHKENW